MSGISQRTTANARFLRGKPVSSTAPASGEVLAYNGSSWAPAAAGGGGLVLVSSQFNTVDGGLTFGAWPNLHTYSLPAASTNGTAWEVYAVMDSPTGPSLALQWRLALGGVALFTLATEAPTLATPEVELIRVRFVRTGATTARVAAERRPLLVTSPSVFTWADVTGLDFTTTQTLASQGAQNGGGAGTPGDWREVLFQVWRGVP